MRLLEYRLESNAAIENYTKKEEKFGIRFFYKDKINTLVIDKDRIKWFYSRFIPTDRMLSQLIIKNDLDSLYFYGMINSEIDYENKKVIFNCYNLYDEVCVRLIFYNFDLEKVDKKVKRILLEREI